MLVVVAALSYITELPTLCNLLAGPQASAVPPIRVASPLEEFLEYNLWTSWGGWDVELTLRQIEIILGKKLPEEAFTTTAWWQDPSYPHVESWRKLRWKAGCHGREGRLERITFTKDPPPLRCELCAKKGGAQDPAANFQEPGQFVGHFKRVHGLQKGVQEWLELLLREHTSRLEKNSNLGLILQSLAREDTR